MQKGRKNFCFAKIQKWTQADFCRIPTHRKTVINLCWGQVETVSCDYKFQWEVWLPWERENINVYNQKPANPPTDLFIQEVILQERCSKNFGFCLHDLNFITFTITCRHVQQYNYYSNFSTVLNNYVEHVRQYTVKKVIDNPVPSRDVTYQTLPGQE
jgi:hypothetical protein